MPIEPGTKLGAYEVQEFVGRGAMGVVYRAYHEGLARPGAVKVLQALAPDAEATARFRREAQAIAQMRHANILNVFDFGEHEGVPYMIVEFVPGGSLADRLKQGERPSHKQALEMLRGIAQALDHAHGLGIVHRDIKPANVLMGRDDHPILADFGLAKLLQSSSVKSMTGVTTGTPAYMAPEQVTGSAVGPAADQYALATMAYELLTGSIPFAGEGVLELLYAHVHRDPPPPSERVPALGPAVDAAIMRGLDKDPSRRWPNCSALVAALGGALSGEEAPEAATLPIAAAPAVAAGAPAPVLARRSRRGLMAGVAIALLVLVAVIAIVGFVVTRTQAPVVSLSSGSVQAGGAVTLRASHLPANQQGQLRLFSQQQDLGTFKADANGDVQAVVDIPASAPAGTHSLQLCWNGSCHAGASLTVTAAPLRQTPTPPPSPTQRAFAHELVLSSTTLKIGAPFMLRGIDFNPAKPAAIFLEQGGKTETLQSGISVSSGGTFNLNDVIPAAAQPGSAFVVGCTINSPGQTPPPTDCSRQQVTLTK